MERLFSFIQHRKASAVGLHISCVAWNELNFTHSFRPIFRNTQIRAIYNNLRRWSFEATFPSDVVMFARARFTIITNETKRLAPGVHSEASITYYDHVFPWFSSRVFLKNIPRKLVFIRYSLSLIRRYITSAVDTASLHNELK